MSITVRNVSKRFGNFVALDDVSLEIGSGELVALLSPSGAGKTTLLRVIAGLEWPDSGQVLFHGADATDTHAREREVGFVFQHYALFRHLTIFENIAFGLRVRPRAVRLPEAQIRERVGKLLQLVQLDFLAARYPHQLSGGQRQRVALARSLAVEPKVLLLDEPFGALDAKVRKELRRWLRRLHDEVHVTTVFVTHDQEEAMEVANRVVVMNRGRIEQVGSPDEVYQNPATGFVYGFLGDVNVFPGRGYARPYEVALSKESSEGSIAATVEHIAPRGPAVRVELRAREGGSAIEADLSREELGALGIAAGDSVFVRARKLRAFDEEKPAA